MNSLLWRCVELSLGSAYACLAYFILPHSQSQATERTQAKDVVAIQLRAQGIPCTAPSSAIKDKIDSRPDEMAWIINCKEASYRVTLIPHIGAKVDVIDSFDVQHENSEIKE